MRLIVPAFALAAVWGLATTHGPTSDVSIQDLGLYAHYADLIGHGSRPYLDFALEYPPLALLPFLLGGVLGTDAGTYEVVFGALMLASALVVLALTAKLARDRAATAAWIVALSPLLTGALVRTHFDMAAVALTLAALVALTREQPLLGFGLLGAGAMTKFFPALILPVAIAWLWGKGDRGSALRGVAVFVAVVAAASLPFAGRGELDTYRFHIERPVQIESTPASVLFALGGSQVTGVATPRPNRFKSNAVEGGSAGVVAAVCGALLVLALAAACALVARRPSKDALLMASAAALLAFVALGKVLSPQFAIWLVPLIALAWCRRERATAFCLAGAIGLTQLEFPSRYFDLVREDGSVIVLAAARNGLLLVALGLTLASLARHVRGPAPANARGRAQVIATGT